MHNPAPPGNPLTRIPRSSDNRVLAGVAGGLGAHTRIEPDLIRAAFIVLTFAGGVGAVVYGLAWLLGRRLANETPIPLETRQRVAIGIMFAGVLLMLRSIGLWFGDAVVLPVALFSFGVAAITARRFDEDRDWLTRITGDAAASQARLVIGATLLVGGVVILLGSIDAIQQAGVAALAVAATAAGLFLILGPWIFRLVSDLGAERRERIRSDERAEMAAHLHDSVLQTLSLIQRSTDPRRMSTLARAQERELRSWLYGANAEPGHLRATIREHAGRVEHEYDVEVDVVTVGSDPPMSDHTRALAQATGEAITNAAKHSGADKVSVFVDGAADHVEVFVTDHGSGFDTGTIDPDRRGIVSSIVGRIERSGGIAEITSALGEGTEVRLWVTP